MSIINFWSARIKYCRFIKEHPNSDQAAWGELAQNGDGFWIRERAVEHITDKEILSKLILNDSNFVIRRAAVLRIPNDQLTLIRAALTDPDYSVRAIATLRIKSQTVLEAIARRDRDKDVRAYAAAQLNNKNALVRVIIGEKDSNVRNIAVDRLCDILHRRKELPPDDTVLTNAKL